MYDLPRDQLNRAISTERKKMLLAEGKSFLNKPGPERDTSDWDEDMWINWIDVYGAWRRMTASEFSMLLRAVIRDGRLVIEELSTFTNTVALCQRDDCFDVFWHAIERLVGHRKDTRITLYTDGLPDEYSFGILWHSRPQFAGWPEDYFHPPAPNAKAFMVGGLIYRGPERTPAQTYHEWTSHT